ncbi:MAG: hypothetical protein AB7T74_05665 [Clostridia bacterium]
MKTSRSPALYSALVLLLVIVLAVAILVPRTNQERTPAVAAIGVDKPSLKVLKKAIADTDPAFTLIEYDDWSDWYKVAGRTPPADLVIGTDGAALRMNLDEWKTLENISGTNLPIAFRSVGKTKTSRYALPLQFDSYEVLYNNERLKTIQQTIPADLPGLETLASALSRPGFAPILVAGGEADSMTRFIGAMIEALGGIAAYEAAVELVSSTDNLSAILDNILIPGLSLRMVLDRIRSWAQAGWLRQDWFRITALDYAVLIETESCAIAFMDLSFHRTLQTDAVERYITGIFPSKSSTTERWLQTTAMIGAIPAKAIHTETGIKLLSFLSGKMIQDELAQSVGLVPANASAVTADLQASDARFALASASGVIGNLGHDCRPTDADREALAKSFRNYFALDGVGY